MTASCNLVIRTDKIKLHLLVLPCVQLSFANTRLPFRRFLWCSIGASPTHFVAERNIPYCAINLKVLLCAILAEHFYHIENEVS